MTILTPARIRAMGNISRWGGWVSSPWSVLDHTLAGAILMRHQRRTAAEIRAWLLHDVEETAFMGDVPTPHKERYCNAEYYTDVRAFNAALAEETGVKISGTVTLIKAIDEIMLRAEYATVSLKVDPEPRMDFDVVNAIAIINHSLISPSDRPVIFWQMWVQHDPDANRGDAGGMGHPPPLYTN